MTHPRITRRELITAGSGLLLFASQGCAKRSTYEEAVKDTWRQSAATLSEPAAIFRELVRYATLAPNGHNTQPWKFRLSADGIYILVDYSRRTPVVDPDDHHLWVSLGCAAENLLQAAPAFGLHGVPTVTGEGIHIQFDSMPVQRTELFNAIPRRQSTRAEYDSRPLRSDEARQLETAAGGPAVGVQLLTTRKELDQIRDFVIAGNSAQMADPAFVRELKDWIRFSKEEAVERRDGLFTGSSGNAVVPSWLGSSMFFAQKAENDKYARHLGTSAGVAVFAARQPNPTGWIAAGRACERFLLQAAALDARTAFINQPVEVKTVRAQFASAIGLGDQRPDMVVRFGCFACGVAFARTGEQERRLAFSIRCPTASYPESEAPSRAVDETLFGALPSLCNVLLRYLVPR